MYSSTLELPFSVQAVQAVQAPDLGPSPAATVIRSSPIFRHQRLAASDHVSFDRSIALKDDGNTPPTTYARFHDQNNAMALRKLNEKEIEHKSAAAGLRVSDSTRDLTAGHNQSHDVNHNDDSPNDGSTHLLGARYYVVAALLGLLFFTVQMDVSIISTSLIAINHDLGHFAIANWLISAYLLGFVGIVVITAKLGDVVGRKSVCIASIITFTVFSAGCAASQTLKQLIVLRAFQGLGGGACFTTVFVMIREIGPLEQFGNIMAVFGIVLVISTIMGPIIGGAISTHTTWRWIFLINLPIGAVCFIFAVFAIPNRFPYHQSPEKSVHSSSPGWMQRLDFLGCLLLFFATTTLTAALQEAGVQFSWDSAYVISLLVISAIFWSVFLLFERGLTLKGGAREPVMPWSFFVNRSMISIMLSVLFIGGSITTTTIQLPQRFQLVNDLTPIDAGVKIIPFGVAFPFGAILANRVIGSLKVPFMYVLIVGAVLQTVGYALLTTLRPSATIPASTYVYQVIAGIGAGISFQSLVFAVPFILEKKHQAVGLSTINQNRAIGSAIFVAVATSTLNGHIQSRLEWLGITNVADLTQSQMTKDPGLSKEQRQRARDVVSEGFDLQMFVACACAIAQIPAALLLWRKQQIRHS